MFAWWIGTNWAEWTDKAIQWDASSFTWQDQWILGLSGEIVTADGGSLPKIGG